MRISSQTKKAFWSAMALAGMMVALAFWMVRGPDKMGRYDIRFFGKTEPKCCLYKLSQDDRAQTIDLTR